MRRALTAIFSLALLITTPSLANASDHQVDPTMKNVDGVMVDSSIPVDSRAELEKFVADSKVPLEGVLDPDRSGFLEVRRQAKSLAPTTESEFAPTALTHLSHCPTNSFCLLRASSAAALYGFTGEGTAVGTWNGRSGVRLGSSYSGYISYVCGPGDTCRSPSLPVGTWRFPGGVTRSVTYVYVNEF